MRFSAGFYGINYPMFGSSNTTGIPTFVIFPIQFIRCWDAEEEFAGHIQSHRVPAIFTWRSIMRLMAIIAGVLLFSTVAERAKAQCTNQSPTQGQCIGSGHCIGYYSIPPNCDGGSANSCAATVRQCCGHLKTVYTGDGCGASVLRNPIARKTLDTMSKDGIQFAVLGCDRHFALYRPTITPQGSDTELFHPRKSLGLEGF